MYSFGQNDEGEIFDVHIMPRIVDEQIFYD